MRIVLTFVLVLGLVPSATAQQLSTDEAGRPVVPSDTTVLLDLPYLAGGHERHKLDLYIPSKKFAPYPVIVWIHGGAWLQGGKHANRMFPLVTSFVADGFAVASINHRFSQQAVFPAQIQDVKSAVRWLRLNAARYGLDPNRFVAWGGSSGGHLAALVGTSAGISGFGDRDDRLSRVQAVVDFFGPTDFLQMDTHRLPEGFVHNVPASPESRLIGGLITEHPDDVRRANPVTYVSRDDPPFLIVHGERDLLVPHHQSQILAGALEKVGVLTVFETVAGGGHGDRVFMEAPSS